MTEECPTCGAGVESAEKLEEMLKDSESCPECGSHEVEEVDGITKCHECGHSE
jgi:hypothetical protein